jgi:hypothetical protein
MAKNVSQSQSQPQSQGRGSNVQAIMRWLLAVVMKNEPTSLPPVPPSSDPNYFNGGSPNMKLLYTVAWYVYAVTTDVGFDIAQKRLLNFLARERLAHGQNEPLSTSHGQLWLGGMGIGLLKAFKVIDSRVSSEIIQWLRVEYALLTLCEHNGDAYTPGGRGFKKGVIIGSFSTRPKFLSALRTDKPGGRLNQFDLGAWAIAKLPNDIRSQIRKWPEEFPSMWGEFRGVRFEDGRFYAYFTSLTHTIEPVLSAGFDTELWISKTVDMERISKYNGDIAFEIHTQAAKLDSRGVLIGV